jgi:hypothetical protein
MSKGGVRNGVYARVSYPQTFNSDAFRIDKGAQPDRRRGCSIARCDLDHLRLLAIQASQVTVPESKLRATSARDSYLAAVVVPEAR